MFIGAASDVRVREFRGGCESEEGAFPLTSRYDCATLSCSAVRILNKAVGSSAAARTSGVSQPAEPVYAVYRPASNATAAPQLPITTTTSDEQADLVTSMTRLQRREYVANFLRTGVCFLALVYVADGCCLIGLPCAGCGLPYLWLSIHL
jgi:hypothetical protein